MTQTAKIPPTHPRRRMTMRRLVNGHGRLSEIIRFGIVGLMATILQYGIYVTFVEAIGVKAVPSTLISYSISFVFNYILSSYFTFHKRPSAQNMLGFVLSHLVNMGLQTGMVAIFKELVGPTLALLPALGICIPLNYLMVRFAFNNEIFKKKNRHDATDAPCD